MDIILTQVASCHLDILSNSKRHEVLQRVHDELFANKNEIGIIVDSFLCGGEFLILYVQSLHLIDFIY